MAQIVSYVLSLKDDLSRGIDGASGAVDNLERKLTSVNSLLGVTFGAAAIGMFTKSMVDAGAKVENANTGLTTLLHNAKEAQDVINNTMMDATKTPFAFEGLLMANKALISAGIESKRAREDVLNLANAISATGGGDSELERMVVNLQQISNTGKATALDIKQFAFAGVNIYKVLEAAGIKTGEKTEITYQQITAALKQAHEAGGIYYNGLENMAGNTSVQISNLGDAIFQLKVKMFNDLKPAITSIVSGLSDFISLARRGWDWAVRNAASIKQWAVGIGVAVVAFKAMTIVPPLILAIENAMVAAATGGISFGASMTAALGPVGLMAAAIGGLAYTFTVLGDNMKRATEERNAFLQTSADKEIAYLKEVADLNGGGQTGIDIAANKEKENLKAQLKDLQGQLLSANTEDSNRINGQITETLTKMNTVDRFQQGLIPTAKAKTLGKPGTGGPGTVDTKTKATGSKSITINVQIQKLGETHLNITNLKEGADKIHDIVVAALTGAVNDFQIVAGQ